MQRNLKSANDSPGQIILIFALMIVGLLVIVGLATDGGMLYVANRNAQTAADASAFAGGLALNQSGTANPALTLPAITAAALARASANGFNADQVTVNWPPVDGAFAGNNRYVQVVVKARIRTSFIQLVVPDAVETTAEAVVKVTPGGPPGDGYALVGLAASACDTVLVNAATNVNVMAGSILSNSNANSDTCNSMEKQGTTNAVNVVHGGIDVVGGYQNAGPASSVNPTPTLGVAPLSQDFLAAPNCSDPSNFTSNGSQGQHGAANQGDILTNSSTELWPGVYNSIHMNGATDNLTLHPGLYCIAGDFIQNGGTLSAANVTIVMLGGKLNFSGGALNFLSAPVVEPTNYSSTNGDLVDYVGLLIFADPNRYTGIADHDDINLGGGDQTSYSGTLFAPNTNCNLAGTSGVLTINSQVYCYTINLNGSATLNFNYSQAPQVHISPTISLMY